VNGIKKKKTFLCASFFVYALIFFFVILLGVLNALRPLSVGTDSSNYVNYYLFNYNVSMKIEPAFFYLTKLLNYCSFSYEWLFFICYLMTMSFSLLFVCMGVEPLNRTKTSITILAAAGFFYLSSWFLTSTTNGLRQGVAVPLVWLAFFFFWEKKYIKSFVFLVLSVSFHYSAILTAPFIFIVRMKNNRVIWLVIVISIGYVLGVNEKLVMFVSGGFNLVFDYDLYLNIKTFGVDSGNWIGFQPGFFIYTLFWFFFYYFISFYLFQPKVFLFLWKIYAALLIMYFVFGFGGYSNRYALYCWQLIPVLHAVSLATVKMPVNFRFIFASSVFIVGLFIYSAYVTGILQI